MKPTERKLAESLRRQGATYREILRKVSVSKSTLSVWLRDIRLTEAQKERIHGKDVWIRRRFVECNEEKHLSAPSSSGPGRLVLSQKTRVRFPVGPPLIRESVGSYTVSLS